MSKFRSVLKFIKEPTETLEAYWRLNELKDEEHELWCERERIRVAIKEVMHSTTVLSENAQNTLRLLGYDVDSDYEISTTNHDETLEKLCIEYQNVQNGINDVETEMAYERGVIYK